MARLSRAAACRCAAWPAEQGGRKHRLTGIAAIPPNASRGWRFTSADLSLDPGLLSASGFALDTAPQPLVSNTPSGRSMIRAGSGG